MPSAGAKVYLIGPGAGHRQHAKARYCFRTAEHSGCPAFPRSLAHRRERRQADIHNNCDVCQAPISVQSADVLTFDLNLIQLSNRLRPERALGGGPQPATEMTPLQRRPGKPGHA